jgi:hypothetical protein
VEQYLKRAKSEKVEVRSKQAIFLLLTWEERETVHLYYVDGEEGFMYTKNIGYM